MEIRELVDVELLDVSPVAYPAYTQTQVSARAIEEMKKRTTPPPPDLSLERAKQKQAEAE